MNRNELEAAAEERLFDVMLGEVARDPVGVRGGARGSRWLAAAIVLLGLAVVAGVVLTSRATPSTAVAPQEPAPLPPVVNVRGMAELQKADRKIENLSCAIEGPDFGVLKEFTSLRALRVEQDHNIPHPTLVQSAWSLAPVVRCTKLEWLTVGPLARFTAVELAPIGALTNLRSLELHGPEKDVDADFVAVLAKLPLRSLVLHYVHILPEGLRALGELPLLERLELRDCIGLEKCDLKHLYRLRQLRALTLRGGAHVREVPVPAGPGAIAIQLPEVSRYGQLAVHISAEWMRGLADALPNLRELDLMESRIDGQVLAALPRGLTFLGVGGVLFEGNSGIAAIAELPDLKGFACGCSFVQAMTVKDLDTFGFVPLASWLPLLRQKKLQRFEFVGVPNEELAVALRAQPGLRELRLGAPPWTKFPFAIVPGKEGPLEVPMPSFACLAELPELRLVELVQPSVALEKAVRAAVPAGVRVDVLDR